MVVPLYITPEQAKNYTGAQAEWFELEEDALLSTLSEWTEHAQDLVTRFIGAEYDPSAADDDPFAKPPLVKAKPPHGVENAVLRIVANMVAQAKLRRITVVLQVDEYSQRLVDDRIFTRAIKDDLAMYQREDPEVGGRRPAAGAIGVGGMIARERRYAEPENFGDWEKNLRLASTKEDLIRYWYGEGRV